MPDPGKPESAPIPAEMVWVTDAETYGILCIGVLVLSLERDDAKLPVELQAWENTMTAMEWSVTQHLEGAVHRGTPYVPEDLERVRRVHALGTEAISGGERSPELGPLADECLSAMVSGWRVVSSRFPICYPPPEGYGDDLERGMSGLP